MISIIVAVSTNNVIGVRGQLPWKISDDLKRFKQLTMGKPIIMGRITWDSIGRPLPGRQNIVITRQANFSARGCDVVASPAAALNLTDDSEEIMIIGGRQIYDLFLPLADRLHITRVQTDVQGDTFFPDVDENIWRLVFNEAHAVTAANAFAFEFRTYERQRSPA